MTRTSSTTTKTTRTSKKKGKKKGTRKKRRSRIPRALNGFPSKTLAHHRFSHVFALPAGTSPAEVKSQVFSLSSLLNPVIGESSPYSQPRGRDELISIYGRYCVVGAKATVKPVNPSTLVNSATASVNGIAYGTAVLRNIVFGLTGDTYNDLVESWGYNQRATIRTDVSASRTLKRNYNLKKFWSHKNPLTDDVMTSTSSSSPSKQAYFAVWATNPGGLTFPSVTFAVEIVYTVVWYERNALPSSNT